MPGKFKNGKTCVLLEDMQILEDGGHRASGAESRLRFFACWYLVLRSQRSRALWQSFEPWTRSADSIAEVACINAGRVKLELGKRIESPSRMLIRSKKECQMVPFAIFCCRRSVVNSFDMAELFFFKRHSWVLMRWSLQPGGAFETAPWDSDLPHQPKSLLWTCFKNNEVCWSLARIVLKSVAFFIFIKPTWAEVSYFRQSRLPVLFPKAVFWVNFSADVQPVLGQKNW